MADFKSAFRAARAAGKTNFSWNGGSYNTKLKQQPDMDVGKAQPATQKRIAGSDEARPAGFDKSKITVDEPKATAKSETNWKPPAEIADKAPADTKVAAAEAPKEKGWGDKWREESGYKRGGYVAARASGKRDYPKKGK